VADRVLFVSWGTPVRGREERGLEVFNEAIGIWAVQEDEDFRRSLTDATLVVDDMRIADGWCNEGIARELGRYQDALSRVPQRA
jgi:hypothetical protein